MPLGTPGPRDWTPNDYGRRHTMGGGSGWSPPRGRSIGKQAGAAFILGLISLVLVLLQPENNAAGHGFLVSTIGVSAIVQGIRTLRMHGWAGRSTRTLARFGIVFGSIGTFAMAYTLLAFSLLPMGFTLPALPTSALHLSGSSVAQQPLFPQSAVRGSAPLAATNPEVSAGSPYAAPQPQTAANPLGPPATTAAAERLQLSQAAGTLTFTLGQLFPAGAFPSTLYPGASTVPQVALATGRVLTPLPADATFQYGSRGGGRSYVFVMSSRDFGVSVSFDSAVGQLVVR